MLKQGGKSNNSQNKTTTGICMAYTALVNDCYKIITKCTQNYIDNILMILGTSRDRNYQNLPTAAAGGCRARGGRASGGQAKIVLQADTACFTRTVK
jgi:hypothetical protein